LLLKIYITTTITTKMAHFLQDRSCNDDFVPLYQNSNSNSNNMDVQEPSIETQTDELNEKKRKRENIQFYAFARSLVNEGEMDVNQAELDPEYCDYAYSGGGRMDYDYDEHAMIQDDTMELDNNGYISQDDEEEGQDDELFQMKRQISAEDISMDLSDSEEDEINADFDELQRLRDELALLRAESAQRRIAFPEGSQIRFIMVDGVRYLQVFQEAHSAPPLTLDDLNCDSEEEQDDYNDF